MKNKKIEITINILIILLISGVISWAIAGFIFKKPDKILIETTENIYVKHYKWYNIDSLVRSYNTPKIYEGIIVNKEIHKRFVGVPGKGGHFKTVRILKIDFNNDSYSTNDCNLFRKYEKGDKVIVKEVWYPNHKIIIE